MTIAEYIEGDRIVNLPISVLLDMFRMSTYTYLCFMFDWELMPKVTGVHDYWVVDSTSLMHGVIHGLPGVQLQEYYADVSRQLSNGVDTLYSVFEDTGGLTATYFGEDFGGWSLPCRDFRIKLLEKIIELNPSYVMFERALELNPNFVFPDIAGTIEGEYED